jgi:hypothetical protein
MEDWERKKRELWNIGIMECWELRKHGNDGMLE